MSNSAAKLVVALTGKVTIWSGVKPAGIFAQELLERRAYCWRPDISGVGKKGDPRPKTRSPVLKVEGEDGGRAVTMPEMLVPRMNGRRSPKKRPRSQP